MFNKKVVLSKTFTDQASYDHFKSLYDSNTVAFENVWHFEFAGEDCKSTVCEAYFTPASTEAPVDGQPAEEAPQEQAAA